MANETKLNMTLLLRRAPFDNSCVLKEGEPGYHTGTKEFKVGDGTTTWAKLPVANETQIKSWIEAVRSDLQGKLDKLDGTYVTDTEFLAYQQAMAALLGTFPIGDDKNQYADIKAYIDAMDAADQAYANAQDSLLEGRINAKIGTKGTASETTIYGAIKAEEEARKAAIGASTDAKDAATVYGAIKAETYAREQADIEINNKIGNIGTSTVASRLEAADQAAADAAGAASAAGQAIDDHKADKDNPHGVTATQLGLGNVDNKSVAEIKTEFTGAVADGNTGFVTGGDVYAADKALENRIETIETFFEGAYAEDGKPLTDALDTLQEIQDYVDNHGKAADKMVKDIKQNADDIDALENIISTGNNNLVGRVGAIETSLNEGGATNEAIKTAKKAGDDAQEAINDHKDDNNNPHGVTKAQVGLGNVDNKSVAEIKTEFTGAVADGNDKFVTGDMVFDAITAAKAAVVGSAISGDSTAQTVEGAKRYADTQDRALKTAIEGTDADESSDVTIAGAKKYAEEKADAAEKNAKDHADGLAGNYDAAGAAAAAKAEVIGKSGDAETADTIYGAKAFATDAASTAEQNAISAVVGTAADEADDDTIKGVRKAFAAADVTTLTSAQTYADTVAANAVKNNIKAGNTDIVITRPTSGEDKDKTVISHKVYGSGTYTKPDSVNDANFVTGVTIENGHVTGASVKSLAEALAAMTFIFDGGTSAN